ncbi:hypothetical protein LFAB_00900 [Lactiplantibacillus fabifermentans T30PCM01]|uniref:Uncharacterized protein n=1 Tax=Lactiplantibacillus fabifermentans T30PCM01 TaxID=1400520 RepID=W6TAQ2_9LACO|nr:hypothetical protein LFAB_00900 [Lactiplantibacillus fabifermentans T30PCM01]
MVLADNLYLGDLIFIVATYALWLILITALIIWLLRRHKHH